MAVDHGRRDARLPGHGKNATRWADGLEAATVDNTPMMIISLDPATDSRCIELRVAGTAALLIAKAYKLGERVADQQRSADKTGNRVDRIKPKDAGDVIRLMRAQPGAAAMGRRLTELARHDVIGSSVLGGMDHLQRLFGGPRSEGVDLAVEALALALDEVQLRAFAPTYVEVMMANFTG